MSDIDKLIRKYSKSYVKGERFSSQTNTMMKREQRRQEKHEVCNELVIECEFLNLSSFQIDFVHYLIDRFSDDFKSLHGRAKKEAIILAFIFE